MTTNQRIDVLFRPEDAEQVQDLLNDLAAEGLSIHEPVPDPPAEVPIAILLTDGLVQHMDEEAVRAIANRYVDRLPVSFFDGAAPYFGELSQSLVMRTGVRATAQQLAVVARHGSRDLAAWNRLADEAAKWKAAGETGSVALLQDSALPDALRLLAGRPARVSAHAVTVRSYVAASSAALRERRRRWTTALSVISVALVVLIVFAGVQTVRADHARTDAERASAVADADRLSRSAIDLVGSDPDLPSVLMDRAAGLADTPDVRGATATVASATWPHWSYRLDYLPREVDAATDSDRIAVTAYNETRVRIYESPGGALLRTFDYHEGGGERGGGVGRISPGGTLVATTERLPGPIKVFEVDSGAQLDAAGGRLIAGDRLLGWWDEGRVLIGRGPQLLSVDVRTGSTTVLFAGSTGDVRSARLGNNRANLAVATERAVSVVDARTGAVRGTVAIDGVTELQVNGSGDHVLAISKSGSLTDLAFDVRPEKNAVTDLELPAGEIDAVDDRYLIVAHRDGNLTVITPGHSSRGRIQTIRAHTGGWVRVEALRNGRIATVARDRVLRVWDPPGEAELGVPTAAGLIAPDVRMTEARVDIPARVSARNQVRHIAGDVYGATLTPGYARTFDRTTMAGSEKYWFFTGLNTDVFLSDNGRFIAAVTKDGVRVFTFDGQKRFWADPHPRELAGTPPAMAIGAGKSGIAAISDDGSTVVMADGTDVSAWHLGSSAIDRHKYEIERTPIALHADADGTVTVLTADGFLRDAAGAERKLPGPDALGTGDLAPATAEFAGPGHLLVVTVAGTLLEIENGESRVVGEIGTRTEPFAIRLSPGGTLVAVLTHQGMVVADRQHGAIRYREPRYGAALVTDIAFTDDEAGATLVTEVGTVRKLDPIGVSAFEIDAPRAVTGEETTSLQLGGASSDG